MKIINFKGQHDRVTILTDCGSFTAYGDLLPDGFLVFDNGVLNAQGDPISPQVYAELKQAGRSFLLENDMEFQLFFE